MFVFLDSMCARWKPAADPSPCFPLLQGQRIEKAIRKYTHAHREGKTSISPAEYVLGYLYIFKSLPSRSMGASTDQGGHWAQLSELGRGQRKFFCFFDQIIGASISPCFPIKQKRKWDISQKANRKEVWVEKQLPQQSGNATLFQRFACASHGWCEPLPQTAMCGSRLWRTACAWSPVMPPLVLLVISSWQCQSELRLINKNAL